ncbi:NADAR family protein [Amycolatopsis sp. FDAARGOS 1241]|uniref:NADAR family protein n=1 Tax=Amycolatopsis sp. FDAARGOS 1241 TaxID=2778070 RepID=UPI00194E6D30|nr:NADAR family protein [Amycolatopsis sp. FDAARGOS 1241]QRP51145.1 NADAR family protein [Amycolatopsis sp. FDAARGOS 1241]
MPFWVHRPDPGNRIGAGCLSQWWPAAFEREGRIFATAEHYMMWRKAVLFGDAAAAAKILAAKHPGQAKAFGREVRGFEADVWNAHRFEIVVEGNAAKFGQNAGLGQYLGNTGERVLVEASPVDRVWGIGLAPDDRRVGEPRAWRGLNLLGFALMEVRRAVGTRGRKPAAE